MRYKEFLKKAKRFLAFALALTLFLGGWSNYDFSVRATETENAGNGPEDTEPVGDVEDDGSEGTPTEDDTPTEDENPTDEETPDTESGDDEKSDTPTGTDPSNSGETPGSGEPADEGTSGNTSPSGTTTPGGTSPDNDSETGETVDDNSIKAPSTGTQPTELPPMNVQSTGVQAGVNSVPGDVMPLADDIFTVELESERAVYTGVEIAFPKVTVSVDGGDQDLIQDTDYTFEWKDKDDNPVTTANGIGTYTCIVTGTNTGSYDGYTGTATFKIDYGTEEEYSISPNTTLTEYVYPGQVKIVPNGEYSIGERADDCNESELVYTSNKIENFNIYLKNPENGEISEVTIQAFTIDQQGPTISKLEISGGDVWTKERSITATCSDSDLYNGKLYYSIGIDKFADEQIVENADQLDGLSSFDANTPFTIPGDSDIEEEIWYIYAIDMAGHITKKEVNVSKIDRTEPTVTLNQSTNWDGTVYWKNSENLIISINVTDSSSGFDTNTAKVTLTKGGEQQGTDTNLTLADDKMSMTGDLTITTPGTYTLSATDAAGNTYTSASFEVKLDTGIPSITLGTPTMDSNGTEAYPDNGTNWTGTGELTIPFTVADTEGAGETEKSAYTVEYSTNEDMTSSTVISVQEGIGELKLEDLEKSSDTYYFRVRDVAGNSCAPVSITVAGDTDKPEVTEVTFDQNENGDKWLNGSEIGSNGVQFSVQAEDLETGIKSIEYSTDVNAAQPVWTVAVCSEVSGMYTFTTSVLDSGTDYHWGIRVTNNVGLSKVWTDRVNVQIDKEAPEYEAYIQFETDTVGSNDLQQGEANTEENSWTSKIFNAIEKSWNKIWGKKKITFEIYVKDKVSGMDAITVKYTGDNDEVTLSSTTEGELKKEEGLKAFLVDSSVNDNSVTLDESASDLNNSDGYTVYTGSITVSKGDLAVRGFSITGMTDIAGNTAARSIALEPVDEEFIFLDAVAPELTAVTVDSESITANDKYYYNSDIVNVVLSIKERFFNDAEEPVVTLHKTVDGITTDQELTVNWTGGTDNIYTSTAIKLDKVPDKETEYYITVSFADPSGNVLAGTDDTNGVFISKIIVLDDIAPKLLSYSVSEATKPTAYEFNGAKVYPNIDGNDLQISFELDENPDYADDGTLSVEIYEKGENGAEKTLIASTEDKDKLLAVENSEQDDRKHIYTFGFDGKKVDSQNEYYVEITCKDAAGNLMCSSSDDLEVEDGTGKYTSESYIIDHVAPIANITLNNAHQVVDGEGNTVENQTIPLAGHTAYYGKAEGQITLTVQITEKYLELKDGVVSDFVLKVNNSTVSANVNWQQSNVNEPVYIGTYTTQTEGDYTIDISYKDTAGNQMAEDSRVDGGEITTDGTYKSPTLILDTTAPILSREYSADPVNSYNGRDYYNSQTNLVITVEDQNIRYGELKNVLAGMTATDINGKPVESTDAKTFIDEIEATKRARGSWTPEIPLTIEANYTIPISYVDLAGNAAVLNTVDQVTVDTTTPADLEFDYSINDPVNYGLFGWLFAQTKMTVRATAKDGTAGLQYIRFTIVDENKKETVRTGEFAPSADGSYSVEIPLESADFKGTVKAEVYDYSNNQIEQTRNHVVESGGKHSSTGSAVITTRTSPSRTVDGEDFYNTDVTFNLTLKDDYSGLRSYTYTGGSTLSGSRNYAEEAGTVLGEGGPEVTYEFSQDMTLAAAQNNENEVKVSAEFVDNAGHTGQVEQLYNIDVTDPEITVEWDLNDPANELYYNQTRTATVTIRERNFDADDVEFTVTNTDGAMPTFGGWSSSGSGDNTEHVCQVTFDQDGDYTFTLSFQDKAGNEASYDRVDEFTIDKTFPELTVTWNNNNSQNEFYYAESRTATIDILEHNFDPNLIDVVTTADGASAPNVSGWSRNGDHNVATVTFSADADYTFDIEGMDLAENALDEYEQEQFTVDQTAPELEIFDIENMSANNGIVMPGVRYSDTNYDPDATVIAMTGYHNGPVEMNGTRTAAANGMEIKLNDFEHVPEMDDMYTMEATVYDLAGNSSEASVIFSVNRFGSVYTFSDATDALVGDNGKYYTNEEQEIVVTETNVDTLEFREITKNLNGSLNTMAEGEEYTVSESGTDVSWKQYTYTIPKENFEEEGTYILTIYSEDRAANTSDNNTKGKQIEFVVDKTSPSILVSGVENDGQYRENSRPVTLDVQDNIRLAEVQVQIDGEETVYTAEEIVEADGKLTLTAGSANHWQEMSVTARDAAGNEETAETIRFLITSNIFVQFFMNKPLFYGTLIALAAAAAGGWRLWIVLKKRKDKEEQQ